MAAVQNSVYETVERTVGGLGYELVDVERLGGGLLRVILDAAAGIDVQDCERVSRQLSHLFAVENVDYQRLEVSSPGLDRALRRAGDFERFVGQEINVQLYAPSAAAGGRKRMRGRLLRVIGVQGCEHLQLQIAPDDAAPATARRTARTRKPAAAAAAVIVEIALADVDKARVVPELNFRPAAAGREVASDAPGTDRKDTGTSAVWGASRDES